MINFNINNNSKYLKNVIAYRNDIKLVGHIIVISSIEIIQVLIVIIFWSNKTFILIVKGKIVNFLLNFKCMW